MAIQKKEDKKKDTKRESAGRRTSNLSRDKGHIYKFIKEVPDENFGPRLRVVHFVDVATKKPLTRQGEATFKGGDVDVIQIISLEGRENVRLERKDMMWGRKLIIKNTGKKTPVMKYDIYALESV